MAEGGLHIWWTADGYANAPLILTLHLWIGVAAAALLLLTGGSGALLAFENQIDAG
jgi:hypothetical protein